MTVSKFRHAFLVGAGMTLVAGPALAQEDCASRIDETQANINFEQMPAGQEERVRSLIQGAQEFAEQNEQQACLDTLAQVRDLVGGAEEVAIGPDDQTGGEQQATAGQQQTGGEGQAARHVPQAKGTTGGAGGVTAEDVPEAERRPTDLTAVGPDEAQASQQSQQAQGQQQQPQGSQQQAQTGQQSQQAQGSQQPQGSQQQAQTGQQQQPQGSQQQAQTGQQSQQAQGQQPPQASQQQAQTGQQSPQAQEAQDPVIGGGPEVPREQLQAKYGPLAWLRFDQVIGAEVLNQSGTTVAEIIALVRDRQDGQFFAVLDTGAGREMVLPVDQLEVGELDKIALSSDAEQAMQPFDEGSYEDVR